MTPRDLSAVCAIADAVHPDFPEDASIFAERLALHPPGCHVLDDGATLRGYVIGHPWRRAALPKLNTSLHALPAVCDCFYLHDLALLETARRTGAGTRIVAQLTAHALALGLKSLMLVAVNRSTGFWLARGFEIAGADAVAAELASYGADAQVMQRRLKA